MSRSAAGVRIGDLGITKALHLYGTTNSYVDVGQHTFLDGKPFTFCTRHWSTTSSRTYDGSLFSYGFDVNTNKGYCIRANGSVDRRVQFFYNGGLSLTTVNFRLIGNKYIFVDFNGTNTARFYDNTTLKDTLVGVGPNVSDGAVHTYIGARDATARYAAGVFGDTAIYDRLLTDDERLAIVSRAAYPTSGLQVMYRMDDESSTIKDYSGNNRNGTMPSGLWRNSPFNR